MTKNLIANEQIRQISLRQHMNAVSALDLQSTASSPDVVLDLVAIYSQLDEKVLLGFDFSPFLQRQQDAKCINKMLNILEIAAEHGLPFSSFDKLHKFVQQAVFGPPPQTFAPHLSAETQKLYSVSKQLELVADFFSHTCFLQWSGLKLKALLRTISAFSETVTQLKLSTQRQAELEVMCGEYSAQEFYVDCMLDAMAALEASAERWSRAENHEGVQALLEDAELGDDAKRLLQRMLLQS